jgi:hypothetical protein
MTIFKRSLNKIVNNYSNSVALDGNPEPEIVIIPSQDRRHYLKTEAKSSLGNVMF